jgi:hypothetical protein
MLFFLFLLTFFSNLVVIAQVHTCPSMPGAPGNSTCLLSETCCVEQYFGAPGCNVVLPTGGTVCCAPGPPLALSTTLPNCLVIGDSVSDQYTPSVAKLLNETCLVQHAPWVGGGSANNAANGLFNLLHCRWLRTALRPDLDVHWDLILFNFGLHDLMNTWPGPLALYTATLANITDILVASGATHVMYALTTPFQADELPSCGPYCNIPNTTTTNRRTEEYSYSAFISDWPQPTNGGNGRCGEPLCEEGSLGCGIPNATAKANSPDPTAPGCGPPTHAVGVLNAAAEEVMTARNVPILDINSIIHSHCGANYSNCSLCDNETQYMGIYCGYHYSPEGVDILANAVATAFIKILGTSPLQKTRQLQSSTSVTFFAASDTHLGHDAGPTPDNITTAYEKNVWAIDEMNSLPTNGTQWPEVLGGGNVGTPFGVTISGDLIDGGVNPATNYDGCAQWVNFTNLFGLDGTDGRLRFRVFEGRGNHDGSNTTLPDPRGCRGHVSTNIVARNKQRAADPSFAIDSISSPTGLHYSWTVNISKECKLHFVHLNLFPGYTCGSVSNPIGEGGNSCKSGDISWPENSLGFLQSDLAKFAKEKTLVITIQHYGFDGFSNGWYNEDQRQDMWQTLLQYNTLITLVGHTHSAMLYSFNGTKQGKWGSNETGFIDVVNAPATQKEDGKKNALPSEFMALEVALDGGKGINGVTGTLRVAQRVGNTWGSIFGSKRFEC